MQSTNQTTTNADELDLGLDQGGLLAEAEAAVATHPVQKDEEVYDVVDLYPEIELPNEVTYSLEMDQALGVIQGKIEYLESELITAQNALKNTVVTLRNKAKAELLAAQVAADEALVMEEIGKPEVIRLLAKVIRVMQSGRGGELIAAIVAIEEGRLPSSMAQLAAAPTVAPTPAPTYQPAPEVQPISTTRARARARTKWMP